MKLHRITIKNYRSISKKTTFELSDFTSLIGPNNEGKTNILRTLTLAFAIIREWKYRPITRKQLEGMYARRFFRQLRLNSGTNLISDFDFDRDYPKHIKKSTSIEIELTFQLTETEIEEFKNETGMNNNGELPLTIKIERNKLSLVINKRGRGNITYNRNVHKIANYIDTRIGILSVPAIRDSTQMLEVAQDFAQRHLQASLFANEHYQVCKRALSRPHAGDQTDRRRLSKYTIRKHNKANSRVCTKHFRSRTNTCKQTQYDATNRTARDYRQCQDKLYRERRGITEPHRHRPHSGSNKTLRKSQGAHSSD